MSSFKGMSEEDRLNHIGGLFAKISIKELIVAHLVMNPEDWILARDIPKIFSPEVNKKRFDKGCCAWALGAYIWIDKGADEMKAYSKEDFAELEKDYPELAKNINSLKAEGELA